MKQIYIIYATSDSEQFLDIWKIADTRELAESIAQQDVEQGLICDNHVIQQHDVHTESYDYAPSMIGDLVDIAKSFD